MKKILLIIIFIFSLVMPVFPFPIKVFEGVVTKVIDRDTVEVKTDNNKEYRVRLAYIDAPELGKSFRGVSQPFAIESKKSLSNKILNQRILVNIISIDRYKRRIGVIIFEGRDINLELVSEGLAETYQKYLPNDYIGKKFLAKESNAQRDKIGIWSMGNYQSPSEFRRDKRK